MVWRLILHFWRFPAEVGFGGLVASKEMPGPVTYVTKLEGITMNVSLTGILN